MTFVLQFEETLKPIHNSVDITEVEFMDDTQYEENTLIQVLTVISIL
jgi:hypothetical protein